MAKKGIIISPKGSNCFLQRKIPFISSFQLVLSQHFIFLNVYFKYCWLWQMVSRHYCFFPRIITPFVPASLQAHGQVGSGGDWGIKRYKNMCTDPFPRQLNQKAKSNIKQNRCNFKIL